ncbi:dihydropteroate synthase [Rhodovulum bhavnagarense]|uniref:Dihydropteroate synthase n=1 Tax=Rhodovulum bhavnagarense TaxID=992286 RepID=A0A4R2RBJ0_9RHOB|nr:dihydropteroate synthase [Rhodovulum bhavnagarense]TCP60702.1 dihydropteroate synthase [Rhodovulum bhavnagarense]
MRRYFRPIVQNDPARPADALPIAGGWAWFTRAEELRRDGPPRIIPAHAIPFEERAALTAPRPALAGLTMDRPRIMGILNVTPDSFSDGGRFDRPEAALEQARALAAASDMIDIGGESTRPGAPEVAVQDEIGRTAPVIAALRDAGIARPISIDTRKAPVAEAALAAGAVMVNDVSGFDFDPALAPLTARTGALVCLMHAQGTPETMQADPRYENVLLDVYDALAARVARAQAVGIPRSHIVVDPGIGFGKTLGHNLALLRGLSLFHGLGCPVLLGASRKSFIGIISGVEDARQRAPGSIAVALAAAQQGVQILRVHDAAETRQALRVDQALKGLDRGHV